MALKALLRNKQTWLLFSILILLFSCNLKEDAHQQVQFVPVDVLKIPLDTLESKLVSNQNGIVYYQQKPYSGFIVKRYPNQVKQSIESYYNGKLQGISKYFFVNGAFKEARSYKENLSYGRHYGYWENGNIKFDLFYINEKSHGLQRLWYANGQMYMQLHYNNDSEDGLQQAWRQNGKLFANYEAKNGKRYGLQKTNLCYSLRKGKII